MADAYAFKGRAVDDILPPSRPASYNYEDVADMIRQLRSLDEQSAAFRRRRDAIIEHCLPLADNIAQRFRNRGESYEDLVQVARVGLVNAIDRFDVECASEFLPFAVPTITGEVRRYFRDHGWALKVPRRMKELNAQLNAAKAVLVHELGRAPTASELSEHLGIDREEVLEGLIAANAYSTHSTDVPVGSAEDGPLITDRLGSLDPNIDKVIDTETVRPLLEALPERERTVLALRFFENMTQTQIAHRMGISQMHVSRLLARSLATMRDQLD